MNNLFPENSYMGKCSCGKEFIAPKGVIPCHNCVYAKVAELEKECGELKESNNNLKRPIELGDRVIFTKQALQAHNLEQQAKALGFALENIVNPEVIYNERKDMLKNIKG